MFNVKSLHETKEIIRKGFNDYPLQKETIKTIDSLGYVIAKDVYSKSDVPHFNRSTVDGYAVVYDDVKLASESSPAILNVVGEVFMGKAAPTKLTPTNAIIIPTGGHVPDGSDAVVMVENTQTLNDEVLIFKKVSRFENVVKVGSDIKKDTLFIKKNTVITPTVIGALMSQNINEVECFKRLSASVISTGDEIMDHDGDIKIGEVRDINTYTISNFLKTNNVDIANTAIVNDDYELYKESIIKGFKTADVVFSSGGSSVGEKDYTDRILQELGAEILVHGLNVKPGKPSIIAKFENKLFVGLPGHPTSAYTVLRLLLTEILDTIYQVKTIGPMYITATLLENVANNSGRTLIQLVEIIEENSVVYAKPLYAKSAMINTLKDANGFIVIDQFEEGKYKDMVVKVYK